MTVAPKMAMASSASRRVEERSVLARSTDAKSHAADRMDQRIGLLIVDLLAHTADIYVDDVGGRIEMQVPYVLQQHGARHNLALVAHQIFENLKFARQQLDLAATAVGRARHQVKLEIADAQQSFLDDGGAATGERLDPGEQLDEGIRFDEIIVAAGA